MDPPHMTLTPQPLELPMKGEEREDLAYLDSGMDSLVYRKGDQVLKIYPFLPYPTVHAYGKLMTHVSESYRENPFTIALGRLRDGLTAHVTCEPFLEIGQARFHVPGGELGVIDAPYATMHFVSGARLRDIEEEERKNPSLAMQRLREAHDRGEIYTAIERDLRQQFGIASAGISGVNIRLRQAEDEKTVLLTITDIASSIEHVMKQYGGPIR